MGDAPNESSQTLINDPAARIILHSGPLAGKFFLLDSPSLTIGRAEENDITLDDAQVSRHHARLLIQDQVIILEDLGSTNGTLVNGKPISKPHVMQPADKVSLGSTVFTLEGSEAPSTLMLTPEQRNALPATTAQPEEAALAEPAVRTGRGLSIQLILGLIGMVVLILIGASSAAYFLTQKQPPPPPGNPEVTIMAPINGSSVKMGDVVMVQISAHDASGITRVELEVGGKSVDSVASPLPGGELNFAASMKWKPLSAGTYSLKVTATNARGQNSLPTTVLVNVTTPSPSATTAVEPSSAPATADTPTLTATVNPGTPLLSAITDLNVRSGPGTEYETIGLLKTNTEAKVIARSADGRWWQIQLDSLPDGQGWVFAEYTKASNAAAVPVATPVPSTPTPTSAPTSEATPTPTASPTLPPEGIIFEFSAQETTISRGDCTILEWHIEGVNSIHLSGGDYTDKGLAGPKGSLEVCPSAKTTYTIRVIKANGAEEEKKVTIRVESGSVPSSPDHLEVSDTSSTSVTLRWDDRSNNETGFRLYNAQNNSVVKTISADDTSTKVSGLKCDKSYQFYLVAYNDDGESSTSNIITVMTSDCQ